MAGAGVQGPPRCVGQYEPGNLEFCDGDPKGSEITDRMSCAWRDRCAGLQMYCTENNQHADVVVATLSYERLVQLCEGYVERHDIRGGHPGGPPDPPKETPKPDTEAVTKSADPKAPTRTTSRRPRKVRTAPSTRGRQVEPEKPMNLPAAVQELGAHFAQTLQDLFPGREFASGKRVLVKPGIFYPVDRVAGSGYVSWYCTTRGGNDLALACVRFKPKLECVDIGLPITVGELREFLGARAFKRLQMKDYRNGQFSSLATKLDREGVGLVVEVLKKLIEADLIAVP